ncbi:MAG: phosphate acyltransferase PlsX [Rhodothermaceae bacterium]
MSDNLITSKCRIIVDAMGGDFAPQNAVRGAIEALNSDPSIELFLTGRKNDIRSVLDEFNLSFDDDHIINTEEVIDMCDSPTNALKTKKDSSIVVGATRVKNGLADAFVSAGNTGAMMAASTLLMGRIKGVGRPTIGAPIPSQTGVCNLFDVGASVDSKPQHLVEYAIMGSIYVEEIDGIKSPKVGLLSVGEEESKGNELTLKALKMLKEIKNINFIGNVEGKDILGGKADIIVCDGYVGNILLKFAESFLGILKVKVKQFAFKSLLNKIKVLLMKGTLKQVLSDFNAEDYGGTPLLGVKGISIIGHGSSSVTAIRNMVLKAKEMHDKQLLQKFEKALSDYGN